MKRLIILSILFISKHLVYSYINNEQYLSATNNINTAQGYYKFDKYEFLPVIFPKSEARSGSYSKSINIYKPHKINHYKQNSNPHRKPYSSNNVMVGYYPDWKSEIYPPTSIPFKKLTHINYAFAIIDPQSFEIKLNSPNLLKEVVELAHKQQVKVLLSIGGWTGSENFSLVAKKYRQKFAEQCLKLIKDYNLDGVDIDWEFPGKIGSECNIVDYQNDTDNFEKLLRELRTKLNNKLITLAVRTEPFYKNQKTIEDASEFYKLVDFINIMAYDVNGVWNKKTAPNAPFNVTKDYENQISFISSIKLWTNAKFKKDKIVMGIPFYGRSFQLNAPLTDLNNLVVEFSKEIPKGDSLDVVSKESCSKEVGGYSGIWQWKSLKEILSQGRSYSQNRSKKEWIRIYDRKTQTPWLYNSKTKVLISYDDPQSLSVKANYVRNEELKGLMIWSLDQDTNNELINSF